MVDVTFVTLLATNQSNFPNVNAISNFLHFTPPLIWETAQ